MVRENISVKFLIHLVGERPALWDKTSEEYKDRSLKDTSWREICTFINENYERMSPKAKEEFTRMIMKKWTHIRDSWVKSMKYGYDEKTKKPPKPYIYHNELQFMQKILKCKQRRYDLGMSYLSNDDFNGYKTETQNSSGDLICTENNADEAGEVDIVTENHDENVEIVKEEIETKIEPTQVIGNPEDNTTDDDDWPLNEVDITPIVESNKANSENEQKRNRMNLPAKKTRTSIFIKACHNSENQEETQKPGTTQIQTPPATPLVPPPMTNWSCTSFNADKYLNDNRHWNFFKGILPSVNRLDEDHTLQFQSGVISLLQKLRESQNSNLISKSGKKHSFVNARGRKLKRSHGDEDCEWHEQTINVSKRNSRRSTRNISDPIAAEESENSTD